MVSGSATDTTYYMGSFQYKNGELNQIFTSEGRVRYDAATGEFNYDYYLKDHLGNTRVLFTDDGTGNAEALQVNNYYPFGMRFNQAPEMQSQENDYLYNGKEKQAFGLDWYDYGARFYDPQLSRWHVIYNKAEKYTSITPYAYALNNPIVFIDPDGNEVDIAYLLSKHKKSLNNMLSTKAGRKFIGRYMKAGQPLKVGNKTYTWDNTGDRAKDLLQIASTSDLGSKGLNRTFKKGTYRKTNELGAKEMENVAKEGVKQVIQVDADLVHADKDADRLTKLDKEMEKGDNSGVIETMINISKSGDEDQEALRKGEVKKYESMSKELTRKKGDQYYEKAYYEDIKNYME